MNTKLEQTTSVWMQTGEIVIDTALTAAVEADVCIIGAGISGMTTANREEQLSLNTAAEGGKVGRHSGQ